MVPRQTGAGGVVEAVLRARRVPRRSRPSWPTPATCTSPRAAPSTPGTWWSTAGAIRSLVYTGATRGREKNTIHVVTGAPDPAQPSRAEREAYTDAAIKQAAELRRTGDVAGARAVRLQMPDRPSDRQLAPWEAVLAQALQQDEPERTALEEMQAAQDCHH